MVFIGFLSRFCLVFLPTILATLPPGVMLLHCSTAPRDSATDIEKASRKDAPEFERLNKSSKNRSYKGLMFSFPCSGRHLVKASILPVINTKAPSPFKKKKKTHTLTLLPLCFTDAFKFLN